MTENSGEIDKKPMDRKLVVTSDGSHTLHIAELNENYHSHFGAVTESEYIFINNGLKTFNKTQIDILEIGFGTGLNAFLTMIEASKSNILINYFSIEKYPLEPELLKKLNYSQLFEGQYASDFSQLHTAPWNTKIKLTEHFWLEKIEQDFNQFEPNFNYDLVYFDAFGPEVQPELWSENNFRKIFGQLNPVGKLLTYSAKGIVKTNLRNSGFEVKRLPGPPGKRHIIQALKQ